MVYFSYFLDTHTFWTCSSKFMINFFEFAIPDNLQLSSFMIPSPTPEYQCCIFLKCKMDHFTKPLIYLCLISILSAFFFFHRIANNAQSFGRKYYVIKHKIDEIFKKLRISRQHTTSAEIVC